MSIKTSPIIDKMELIIVPDFTKLENFTISADWLFVSILFSEIANKEPIPTDTQIAKIIQIPKAGI